MSGSEDRSFSIGSSLSKFPPNKMELAIYEALYVAYATNDPQAAFDAYVKRTGIEPTVIVARPEISLTTEHPILIRSRFGAATVLLVSHVVSREEIQAHEGIYTLRMPRKIERAFRFAMDVRSVKAKPGRPAAGGGLCPHCGQVVKDFNELGWWWGWEQGIEPPYWQDLRMFVFRRDDFRCQNCAERYEIKNLTCHHVKPKEHGGTDSARNLTTTCIQCHPDFHPILNDEEEQSG